MEDVLDQYEQPYDPKRPLVCFDEWLKQLIEETRISKPAKPGQVERYDRRSVCPVRAVFAGTARATLHLPGQGDRYTRPEQNRSPAPDLPDQAALCQADRRRARTPRLAPAQHLDAPERGWWLEPDPAYG
jgi:hypothetical protein